ncbi:CPS_collapsed_G0017040.mRNA.1.CDS.1 [Saccharomyces cerevisiae]|nr:CPS_collapsed_G0017040.mRNA.1.CDS.1 [Saccharomyces cerevisiae]
MIKASKRFSFHSKKYEGKNSYIRYLEFIRRQFLVPSVANALKNLFDEEGATDNSFTLEDDRWFEVNAIAGCFKMYLRELPGFFVFKCYGERLTDLAIKYKSTCNGKMKNTRE